MQEARALRDYYGRAASELTDTEVFAWALRRRTAMQLERRGGSPGVRQYVNPDYNGA